MRGSAFLFHLMKSPESTGLWQCPECWQRRFFVGYDDEGYGGPEECYDIDGCCGEDGCRCTTTLRQEFLVEADGEINYRSFTGGGVAAEIGSYTRIYCGECNTLIYLSDEAWRPKCSTP